MSARHILNDKKVEQTLQATIKELPEANQAQDQVIQQSHGRIRVLDAGIKEAEAGKIENDATSDSELMMNTQEIEAELEISEIAADFRISENDIDSDVLKLT